MFKAVIKYLWGKCTEHPCDWVMDMNNKLGPNLYGTKPIFPEHRFNCPQCMEQFKERFNEKTV